MLEKQALTKQLLEHARDRAGIKAISNRIGTVKAKKFNDQYFRLSEAVQGKKIEELQNMKKTSARYDAVKEIALHNARFSGRLGKAIGAPVKKGKCFLCNSWLDDAVEHAKDICPTCETDFPVKKMTKKAVVSKEVLTRAVNKRISLINDVIRMGVSGHSRDILSRTQEQARRMAVNVKPQKVMHSGGAKAIHSNATRNAEAELKANMLSQLDMDVTERLNQNKILPFTKKAQAVLEKLAWKFNKYETDSLPKFIKHTWNYGPGKPLAAILAATGVIGTAAVGAAGYGAYRAIKGNEKSAALSAEGAAMLKEHQTLNNLLRRAARDHYSKRSAELAMTLKRRGVSDRIASGLATNEALELQGKNIMGEPLERADALKRIKYI